MRFIWCIITIILGVALIKYSFPLTNLFGHIDWAENNIGGGGTNTLYKIVGIILIIGSFMYLFNLLGFITGPLAPIFGAK